MPLAQITGILAASVGGGLPESWEGVVKIEEGGDESCVDSKDPLPAGELPSAAGDECGSDALLLLPSTHCRFESGVPASIEASLFNVVLFPFGAIISGILVLC